MFLVIDLKNNVKGYINLGNDLSQAQDLLNMFENNIVFVKDDYRVFEKVTASCTVEVVKEITLSKEGYGDTYDTLQIGNELDKEFIGTLSEPIECERDIKSIQQWYLDKIQQLRKELSKKDLVIQQLEDSIEYLEKESN